MEYQLTLMVITIFFFIFNIPDSKTYYKAIVIKTVKLSGREALTSMDPIGGTDKPSHTGLNDKDAKLLKGKRKANWKADTHLQ